VLQSKQLLIIFHALGGEMSIIVECIENLQAKLEKHRNVGLKETPTRTIFIADKDQAGDVGICPSLRSLA
jgi:hypothetical protein